jgi:hypothetical protein
MGVLRKEEKKLMAQRLRICRSTLDQAAPILENLIFLTEITSHVMGPNHVTFEVKLSSTPQHRM